MTEKKLSPEEVYDIVSKACDNYTGQADDLREAIGLLFISIHYGWRIAYLTTNRRLLRRCEKILGLKLEDITEPEGRHAHRSKALKVIKATEESFDKFEKLFKKIFYNHTKKPVDSEEI